MCYNHQIEQKPRSRNLFQFFLKDLNRIKLLQLSLLIQLPLSKKLTFLTSFSLYPTHKYFSFSHMMVQELLIFILKE